MIWGAIIVAAGRGTRFGRPKQLVDIGGMPMLAWSLDVFAAMPEISELVIVTESEFVERVETLAHERVRETTVRVVHGGADRQASVRNGLDALTDNVAAVLVHDGARPLVQAADVRAGMRPVRPGTASLLATPVIDTIKVVGADGKVTRTLDRATLWAAQTPQFATARDLRRAHADAQRFGGGAATDDATLLERAGLDVVVVESPLGKLQGDAAARSAARRCAAARARACRRARRRSARRRMLCRRSCGRCGAQRTRKRAMRASMRSIAACPSATMVRAYVASADLRGFGARLHALAGEDAVHISHLSHVAPRVGAAALGDTAFDADDII